MQLLLIAGILLAYGPTLAMADFTYSNEMLTGIGEKLKKDRDVGGKIMGIKAEDLKPTDSLKVPEIECGRNYEEEGGKIIEELAAKYPSDERKQMEELDTAGEETVVSCTVPSRSEINCKHKECEGSEDSATLCICGPKKCKLDSDGFCEKKGSKDGDEKKKDDEEDESSSLFVFGTILNLTIFYLISSFF